LTRQSPLTHRAGDFAAASGEAVAIAERPFLAQVGVRLLPGDGGPSAVEAALGFALPVVPNTTASANGRTALWLGPDEWLVVAAGDASPLELELAEALGDGLGSVVDLSANRTAIELRGPAARDVLAKGCALDLHPRAFAPGACAQTLLARAQVILEQLDDAPAYRLLVRGSFSDYLATWLLDAMAEFQDDSSRRMASLRQRSVRATSLNV
jgi:sarcosine oxidase subunit gamma